jgi:hypothetical protein
MSWMMDEFIFGQNPKYIYNPPQNLQGMTNNVGLTFSVGDAMPQCTINTVKDN